MDCYCEIFDFIFLKKIGTENIYFCQTKEFNEISFHLIKIHFHAKEIHENFHKLKMSVNGVVGWDSNTLFLFPQLIP